MIHPLLDREDAGKQLAKKLQQYKDREDAVIVALVRGGVAVGRAMADELHLPLYPYVVRKIGHPGHREYGMGAIAEGGGTYLDETAMKLSGVEWTDLEGVIEEEMEEMKRRKKAYHARPFPNLDGKTIIITDDGAATGSTMFAAVRDMQKFREKEIIVALPVVPPDTLSVLNKKADKVVTLATPEPFNAVGQWYLDFPQLTDEDVLELLQPATQQVF